MPGKNHAKLKVLCGLAEALILQGSLQKKAIASQLQNKEKMVEMKKNKQAVQSIALERIYRLFELAGKEFPKNPERSRRYVQLARAIGKRNNVRIPLELKTKFCKKCSSFLVKGKNADIENEGNITVVKCRECGFVRKTGEKMKARE